MNTELVSYLFRYYSHLAPLRVRAKIKYPYLNAYEVQKEKATIAQYLIDNHSNEIFINNCPVCGKLTRTPEAKQCRHCGHDWR